MSKIYIQRKVHCGGELVYDYELLEKSGVLVVLAEPGAGKTDLLDYLGWRHTASRELASLFIHRPVSTQSVLIIDALDEVARLPCGFSASNGAAQIAATALPVAIPAN
jgi:hypothetical protein